MTEPPSDTTGADISAQLATAARSTRFSTTPEHVQRRLVLLVTDALGVISQGTARREITRLVRTFGAVTGQGRSTVIGSPRTWPAATATFLNGAAVGSDQLQDGHRLARGHPVSHLVPALLAYAEELDASAETLLTAILVGYEIGARIGLAMGGTPAGIHDIGTWGEVAVAVGVAALAKPGDADCLRRAIDLAGSAVLLTDAATVFAGRPAGHAFLGASAALGSALGWAAVSGLDAEPGGLQRHLSRVAASDWDGDRIRSSITAGSDGGWSRFEVLRGYVKLHPTCAHLHGVNDAVQELLDRRDRDDPTLTPDSIDAILVRTYAGAARFDGIAATELAARFSIPTSVALAIVTGRLDEESITNGAVTSPEVIDLAKWVKVVHDRSLDAAYPAGRPSVVSVTFTDGRTVTARVQRPRGDGNEPDWGDVVTSKAQRLLARRFGPAARQLYDLVTGWPTGATPRELGTALRDAARGAPANATNAGPPSTWARS